MAKGLLAALGNAASRSLLGSPYTDVDAFLTNLRAAGMHDAVLIVEGALASKSERRLLPMVMRGLEPQLSKADRRKDEAGTFPVRR